MKKNLKIIMALFLVTVIVTVQGSQKVEAYPTTYIMNITKYQQEKSNWCWAATAKMIASFLGYQSITQSGIVGYIKGSTVNETASQGEIRSAIQYAINSQFAVRTEGVLFHIKIQEYISNRRPLGLGVSNGSGMGHVVVVSGYGSGTVTIIDPAANVATKSYTYNSLVNGVTSQYGSAKYTTTWTLN